MAHVKHVCIVLATSFNEIIHICTCRRQVKRSKTSFSKELMKHETNLTMKARLNVKQHTESVHDWTNIS